jgi:hypothetical protein
MPQLDTGNHLGFVLLKRETERRVMEAVDTSYHSYGRTNMVRYIYFITHLLECENVSNSCGHTVSFVSLQDLINRFSSKSMEYL